MEISVLLTFISLTLGLIGAFKKTSKERADGTKIPTKWGYIVAALMIISASTAIYAEWKKQHNAAIAAEQQAEDAQQQRLLSMLAVSSNFDIAFDPRLELNYQLDSAAT